MAGLWFQEGIGGMRMLDNIREWVSDNLRYILLGLAAVILIIIICLVVSKAGKPGKKKEAGQENTVTEVQTEAKKTEASSEENDDRTEQETQSSQIQTEAKQTEPVLDENSTLVKDDAVVLTLVRQHYNAIAQKDSAVLGQTVSPWSETVENKLLANDTIESYENISTYSKDGPKEGSYVVFVYFEGKVAGFDTLVPSLYRLYVFTDVDGKMKIASNVDADPQILDFIQQATLEDDVKSLIAEVNVKYEQAIESDPSLKAFFAGEETAVNQNAGNETRISTTGINLRPTPSTEQDALATVPAGAEVTVLEDLTDGWSHITYDDGSGSVLEGYVRTEYLS